MILTGENRSTGRETCPSATLSTTNPTWIDLKSNLGLRGERPAIDSLSHGTALFWNRKFYCVLKNSPYFLIPSQLNPFHSPFLMVSFNISIFIP
jgi:hypothetical protein